MNPAEPPRGSSGDAPREPAGLRPGDRSEVGPYRLHGRIGRGGMGEVYLAEDPRLDRRVALKVLLPEDAGDERARRRLIREARAAAALDHPNIATVYEVDETRDGLVYLAMAYYEGESLADRLRRGPLTVEQTLGVAIQAARGLARAHAHGVVHRDLKPANLMVTSGGVLKIVDFGIARVLDATRTATEAGAGTLAYMSPEQIDGTADARTDLWSLGVVLYEALAGAPPFRGETVPSLMREIVDVEPPPIDELREDVPPALARVIAGCLAKDPEDRTPNAEALLAELSPLATPADAAVGRPARAAGAEPPSPKPRARWPRLVPAVVGLLAVAGVGFLVASWIGDRGAPVPAEATTIAVMPFQPAGADTALDRLGQELAVLISSRLGGVGEIATADALTILGRAGQGEVRAAEEDASLAASMGAGSVLRGTLVRSGDRVEIDATLARTADLEPIAQVGHVGPPEDPGALADSLALALLGEIWQRGDAPVPSPGAIGTRSLPALRAYLEGERALARAEFDIAVQRFERAFEVDSAFYFAYWRSLYPRIYEGSAPDPEILDRLVEHVAEFPERDRLLFEARRLPALSDQEAALEELTRRFPDYWAGWYALGDLRIHWTPYLGSRLGDARGPLRRVLELHPGFASAWTHLLWIDVFERDTAAARLGLEHLAEFSTPNGIRLNPAEILYYEAVVSVATHGDAFTPERLERDARFLAGLSDALTPIQQGTGLLDMDLPRGQVQIGERVLELAVDAEVEAAMRIGLMLSLAARGDWDSALVAAGRVADAVAAGVLEDAPDAAIVGYGLATMGVHLNEIPESTAAPLREIALTTASQPASRAEIAWLDGIRAYHRRDSLAVAGARDAVASSGAPFADVLDRSLAAFQRALAGDSIGAGRDLAALEIEGAELSRQHHSGRRHPFLNGVNRLSASRWIAGGGDTLEAARLLNWSESVLWNAQRFLDPVNRSVHTYALLARARLEEGRGRSEEAARLYRRFIERYDLGRSVLIEEALAALRRVDAEVP